MKEILDELKDNQSKKSVDRMANNFTFNKDEIEVADKQLSEDDLQNMRSLKSELSNSKRIDVIEEAREENQSEGMQNSGVGEREQRNIRTEEAERRKKRWNVVPE